MPELPLAVEVKQGSNYGNCQTWSGSNASAVDCHRNSWPPSPTAGVPPPGSEDTGGSENPL